MSWASSGWAATARRRATSRSIQVLGSAPSAGTAATSRHGEPAGAWSSRTWASRISRSPGGEPQRDGAAEEQHALRPDRPGHDTGERPEVGRLDLARGAL